jgi:hypothetical protein
MYKKRASEEIGNLSKKDIKMIMVGLYWGEGSKSDNRFVFSNSDPGMVQLLVQGLQNVWKIHKKDFICRVLINKIHITREDEVLRFWHDLLELHLEQFRSTTFVKVKPKKEYENYNRYFGTLKVSIRKSSHLHSHFMGLIDAVKGQDSV